jgi:endo-1,3(4)-beta-glucanase
MWGKVSNNPNLEASGDLRLAIQKTSFHHYFLMDSSNNCQPQNFIANKVTGIVSIVMLFRGNVELNTSQLFDNKIDHATYFGGNIEYIQGIHMIPCSPVSSITRSHRFGKAEEGF